jgi:hypothetical protein
MNRMMMQDWNWRITCGENLTGCCNLLGIPNLLGILEILLTFKTDLPMDT